MSKEEDFNAFRPGTTRTILYHCMKKSMNDVTIKHSVAYDEEADVLYVTFGTEPSYCEDIDGRLLVERGIFSRDPTGYRIINFKKLCKEALGSTK